MVFQYNPLIHFMEVNAAGEVICTVSRLDLLSPRIRYNVHDQGGIVEFATVKKVAGVASASTSTRSARRPRSAGPAGRSRGQADPAAVPVDPRPADATISVMGSNIYPEDIETVVYRDPELVPPLHSFLLSVADDASGTPRPHVALELVDLDGVDDAWRARPSTTLRDGLVGLNIDYRSSIVEFPAAMQPIVETYAIGGGPFAADAGRIKQRRIS